MLNAGILSFRVLSDEHGVHVIVGRLEALDRYARSDVGKKVESPAQSQVEGNMSLSDLVIVSDVPRRETYRTHSEWPKDLDTRVSKPSSARRTPNTHL